MAVLWQVLLIAFVFSLLLSFVYMVQKRGVLSALFWSFIPMRLLLSWGSDMPYDDNPDWLDRIQWSLIVAMGLIWLAGKAKLLS